MAKNRGKAFEQVVRKAFEQVPNTSVDRVHDQTTKYRGSTNICDFIVYRKPYEYYIECKAVHGNILSIHSIPKLGKDGKLHGFYGNITDAQWQGLLEKSKIVGVRAGVICWWVNHDVTKFLSIEDLEQLKTWGFKSVRFDQLCGQLIPGKKKRVFFEYDMEAFLDEFI